MNLNELLTEEFTDQYDIYCDLDGVLCDFVERFEHFSGISPEEYTYKAKKQFGDKKGTERFWDLIDNQVGIRFWRGMKWTPEGKKLWNYIKSYKPTILTSPSLSDTSIKGKTLWVQDNLGDNEIIFKRASEKQQLSGPNRILIDDQENNILQWKSQNGIGILYTTAEEVILELQKIGIKNE